MKKLKTTKDYMNLLSASQKVKIIEYLDRDCYGIGYGDNDKACLYCHDNINCLSLFKDELNKDVKILVENYLYLNNMDDSKIKKNTEKILIAIKKYNISKTEEDMSIEELKDLFMDLSGCEDIRTIDIYTERFLKEHRIKVDKEKGLRI